MPAAATSFSPLEVPVSVPAGSGPSETPGKENPGPPVRVPGRKILILDDDQEFLDTYCRILSRLPCQPEVRVASCATRALALLEAEPFSLLITDLRMPKIDGFQVLMSARRRFPVLKTVAITALGDQQYRARAYASGIDLYTEKPTTPTEIRLFTECVEALLTQGTQSGGFRGIQRKSLADLIQLECLSRKTTILRATRGPLEGRIWIRDGAVIDAEMQEKRGEDAFKHILAWKSGHFDILPGDEKRPRAIFTSCESLLLDGARTAIEAESAAEEAPASGEGQLAARPMSRRLEPLAAVRGIESLLLLTGPGKFETWGVENPEEFAGWTHRVLHEFQALGELLNAGPLRAVEAAGPVRGVVLLPQANCELMAGIDRKLGPRFLRTVGKELAAYLGKE